MLVTRVIGTKIRRRPNTSADQAQHPRLADLGADGHHEVAHLADLVPLGVEDRQADQAGGVHAGRGRAHAVTLPVRRAPTTEATEPREPERVGTVNDGTGYARAGYPDDDGFVVRGPARGGRGQDLGGAVSKHALTASPTPRPAQGRGLRGRRASRSSTLFVGGATGMIGSGDDDDDGASARGGRGRRGRPSTGTDEPATDDRRPTADGGTGGLRDRATSRPRSSPACPRSRSQGAKQAQAHAGLAAPRPGRRDDVPRRHLQRARQLPHRPGRQPQGLGLRLHPDGLGLVADQPGRRRRWSASRSSRTSQYYRMRSLLRLGRLPRPDPRPRLDPQLAGLGPRRVGPGRGQQHRHPLLRRPDHPPPGGQAARTSRPAARSGSSTPTTPPRTPNHGNNARWRAAAIGIEVDLANELGADGTPVVFTGDFNDRAEAFCPIVGGTELEAANGGGYSGGCDTPDRMDVDWIFGSGIEWSSFASASQGVVGPGQRPPVRLRRGLHPRGADPRRGALRRSRRPPATARTAPTRRSDD